MNIRKHNKTKMNYNLGIDMENFSEMLILMMTKKLKIRHLNKEKLLGSKIRKIESKLIYF
jgi:hypothetical protein